MCAFYVVAETMGWNIGRQMIMSSRFKIHNLCWPKLLNIANASLMFRCFCVIFEWIDYWWRHISCIFNATPLE